MQSQQQKGLIFGEEEIYGLLRKNRSWHLFNPAENI